MTPVENEIATALLDVSFDIHKKYGPGLFESVYEEVLCYELAKRNLLQQAAVDSVGAR